MIQIAQIIENASKQLIAFPDNRLPQKIQSLSTEVIEEAIVTNIATEVMHHHHKFKYSEDCANITHSIARWFTDSKKHGLILYGAMGTGKTTALTAMYRFFYRYKSNSTVLYTSAVEIHAFSQAGEYEKISQCVNANYLFIDDIGHEPSHCMNYGVPVSPIEDIICRRYEKRRTTIFTSNLGDSQLENRYGNRMADRVYEEYDTIVFDGENYRRQ